MKKTFSVSLFKYLLVCFLMLAAPTFAQEQNTTVSGVATDEQKIPLPGVSVMVKGTKKGTQTDFDGKFKIQATASDQLIFTLYWF